MLEAAKSTAWPDPDRAASAAAVDRLATALSLCWERFPAVLNRRRKEPKQACPAWAEVGAELIQVLLQSLPCQGELLATQLSDALELASSPSVASAATARQLMKALLLDTKSTLDALPHSGCVVWAPADPSCLGRVLTAFIQHAAGSLVSKTVWLLVPVHSRSIAAS